MATNYTMSMFKEDFADCKNQLSALGYELQDNIPLVFNNRATKRFGQCSIRNGIVTKIELSTKTFGYRSREEIKNTVMHEAIHALKQCHREGHKGEWLRIANQVNRAYGYKIKRCSEITDTEAYAEAVQSRANYTVKCEKCGHEWHYQRMSNCVKNPSRYIHTGCGGHIVNAD